MSKEIKYSLTYLGTIELEDDEDLTDDQIMSLITEDAYDNYNLDIGYANDVDYSVEEENMDTWDFEFVVECVDEMGGVIHTYTSIEADTEEDAKAVAEEFCREDFPGCAFAEAIIKEAVEIAELERMAEIAEYERISTVNPYCI